MDENGNVVKTYSNMGELADEKLKNLIDKLLSDSINKSEELYGKDYKNDLQRQVNNLKQNITKTREVLCELFFYTEDGYNAEKSIENAITFVGNATLFAMMNMNV